MWCDNCLLIFPLGAGSMVLGVILALYQFAGGVLLFEFGEYFFFHYPEAEIYSGYAMLQGAVAILAVIAFSTRSFAFTRIIFRIYPIVLLLGAVRAGVMAWSLQKYKSNIVWTCTHNGIKWSDGVDDPSSPNYSPPLIDDSKRLPPGFCARGVDNFITIFTAALILDFILMCYFCFLLWRMNVKFYKYYF